VAPLTVAAGLIPTAYGVTGLTGIPAAFLGVAVILGVFATGYMAMSRSIVHAGAFYAFIAQGLGRAAGVAAAMIALLAYSCLQIVLYGMLGPAAASQAATHLGVHAAWWAWALGARRQARGRPAALLPGPASRGRVGHEDPAFTPRWLDLWLKTFPHADVLRLPDAGHYLQEDAHERIIPALLHFLGPGSTPAQAP